MLLLFLVARFHELYKSSVRAKGFSTALLSEETLASFPRNIIPEERRRRTYWNGVLARAEIDSSYRPQRKLWRRERTGHYVPSSIAVRIANDPGKPDTYVPLTQLLALDLLEPEKFASSSLGAGTSIAAAAQ